MEIRACNFVNNIAFAGSTVLVSGSQLTVRNILMKDNEANAGGCIQIRESSLLTVKNSTFMNNEATKGGVFFAIAKSQFEVNSSSITGNYA